MSDILGFTLTFHVFTRHGDFYVSDNRDGDRVLASVVVQYPDATVVTEDRDSGESLSGEMPLIRLLEQERGLLHIGHRSRHVRRSRREDQPDY